MHRRGQDQGGGHDTPHRYEQPVKHLAAGVAHLGDDQLATNVGEYDAYHEGVTARVTFENVSRRAQYPHCGQGEKQKRTD